MLPRLGLEGLVYGLGLDYDVGPRGQALFSAQRASVSLARALVGRPRILILEDAFKNYGDDDTVEIQKRIRERMRGATLIMTCPTAPEIDGFDHVIHVDGARVAINQDAVSSGAQTSGTETRAQDPSAANMEAGE